MRNFAFYIGFTALGFFSGALAFERPAPWCFSPEEGVIGKIEEANTALLLFDNASGSLITVLPMSAKDGIKKLKQVSCQ